MRFFETLEKQPCKRRSDLVQNFLKEASFYNVAVFSRYFFEMKIITPHCVVE